MQFIHSQNPVVLHRDLKPENILLAGDEQAHPKHWRSKICDFGVAKAVTQGDTENSVVGTPYYIAPEIFRCDDYDHHADIYSFGMTILCMATFHVGGLPNAGN